MVNMKDNDFFDHKNLNNQTPFDRMENEGIDYLNFYKKKNHCLSYLHYAF